jgi:hypothetical protein
MEVSLKQLAAILHLSERRVRQLRDEQGILAPEPGTGSNSKAKKYRLEKCVPEYINFKITFDLSQCFSWSTRPYIIDKVMGLNGKDNNRYFDLMGGVKLSWMFPFTGKTSYDYYYY